MSNTPDKSMDEKVTDSSRSKSDQDKNVAPAVSSESGVVARDTTVAQSKASCKTLTPAVMPGAVSVTPVEPTALAPASATKPGNVAVPEAATRSPHAKMGKQQQNNAAHPKPITKKPAEPGAVAISAAASRTTEAKGKKMGQSAVSHQEAGTAVPGATAAASSRSEKAKARIAYPEQEESSAPFPGATAQVSAAVDPTSKEQPHESTTAGPIAAGLQDNTNSQGYDASPDYTVDDQGTPQIVATLVDEEAQHNENMVVAVAQKDSFIGLLRHDRRTRMIAACFIVALVGLGVGLGVALSNSGDDSPEELEEAYLQAGSNIDGPDKFFEHGSGVDSKFGSSVSLSGDGMFLAVGAPEYSSDEDDAIGLVQLFEERDNDWVLLETYLGESEGDRTGMSVSASLDGNTVAIASPGYMESRGQVQVYARSNTTWELLGSAIVGEFPGDELGTSVSIAEDGRRVAVGIKGNLTHTEFAKVFDYQDDKWTQVGGDLEGHVGSNPVSLSSDGTTVSMGSLSTAENDFVGAIRVYEYKSDNWGRRGSDVIVQGATGNYDTGWSTSLSRDGKTMAIGSSVENAQSAEEYDLKVLIYRFDFEGSGDWTQQGETQHNKSGSHLIAYRVALSADAQVLAIGDPGGFAMGINSGHTHVLRWQNEEWFHITRELEGTDAADRFGDALSLSEDGNRIGVGAPSSRATGEELGRVQIYELTNVE